MKRRAQKTFEFGYDESDVYSDEYWEELISNYDLEDEFDRDTFDFSDDLSIMWDDFIRDLQQAMDIVGDDVSNGVWVVSGSNMGWRNTSGEAVVEAGTAKDLLRKIMPDADYTVKGSVENGAIYLSVYHHDSPTGEGRTITPFGYEERYEAAVEHLSDSIAWVVEGRGEGFSSIDTKEFAKQIFELDPGWLEEYIENIHWDEYGGMSGQEILEFVEEYFREYE